MVVLDTPGQLELLQYSHCPFHSYDFEHQGCASPSMMVQVSWSLPLKIKGKTQLPQEMLVEVVVVVTVEGVVVEADEVVVVADDDIGGHVFKSGIFELSQLVK